MSVLTGQAVSNASFYPLRSFLTIHRIAAIFSKIRLVDEEGESELLPGRD
jgi:hypothetical protein